MRWRQTCFLVALGHSSSEPIGMKTTEQSVCSNTEQDAPPAGQSWRRHHCHLCNLTPGTRAHFIAPSSVPLPARVRIQANCSVAANQRKQTGLIVNCSALASKRHLTIIDAPGGRPWLGARWRIIRQAPRLISRAPVSNRATPLRGYRLAPILQCRPRTNLLS